MFNIYLEKFGTTYEPAEGGYNVEISEISLWDSFDDVESARKAIDKEVADCDDVMFADTDAYYYYSTGSYDPDGNAITEEENAEFICEVERNSPYYQGCGCRFICIDDGKPEPYPEVYVGYR